MVLSYPFQTKYMHLIKVIVIVVVINHYDYLVTILIAPWKLISIDLYLGLENSSIRLQFHSEYQS